MWILKGLFNSALILFIFSAGFYARHKADPIYNGLERVEEAKTQAASLWPF